LEFHSMGYRITTVSRLTGIPRNTLLAWERRYSLVTPERLENGYRSYTDTDIEYLRTIKQLVDSGYRISEAIALVDERAAAAIGTSSGASKRDFNALRKSLTDALLDFDRSAAEACILPVSMSGHEFLLDALYLPILREVGEGWHAGRISVAQEHFASAFIRERMLAMLVAVGFGPRTGRRTMCVCMSGERHDGGLLSLSVRLTLRGHRVSWLGSDVPVVALVDAARTQRSELVCVSCVVQDPEAIEAYARTARAGLSDDCTLVVGGNAVDPKLLPAIDGVHWVHAPDALWTVLDDLHDS
jgi:DNA-binding transcriptional MerR regulator